MWSLTCIKIESDVRLFLESPFMSRGGIRTYRSVVLTVIILLSVIITLSMTLSHGKHRVPNPFRTLDFGHWNHTQKAGFSVEEEGDLHPLKHLMMFATWAAVAWFVDVFFCTLVACRADQLDPDMTPAVSKKSAASGATSTRSRDPTKIPRLMQAHWITHVIGMTSSAIVFAGYWLLTVYFMPHMNLAYLPLHGPPFLYYLADFFLMRTPYERGHFYIPVGFFIFYMLVTLIYILAGGPSPFRLDIWKADPVVLMILSLLGFAIPLLAHALFCALDVCRQRCHRRCDTRREMASLTSGAGSNRASGRSL